jgi:hypothetical protein
VEASSSLESSWAGEEGRSCAKTDSGSTDTEREFNASVPLGEDTKLCHPFVAESTSVGRRKRD